MKTPDKKLGRPPKSPDMKRQKVSLTLPKPLLSKANDAAYASGRSLSEVIQEAIEKDFEKQVEIKNAIKPIAALHSLKSPKTKKATGTNGR